MRKEGVAEDISGIGGENGRRGNGTGRKRTRRGFRADKGCEIPDEAGKRRLEKGAKPTVFFVAGDIRLVPPKTSSHFFTFPTPSCDFLAQRLLHPRATTIATPTRRYCYYHQLNYHRRHEDRLVVVEATYFSAQSLARLEPLFRHRIFTNIQDGGIISPALRGED